MNRKTLISKKRKDKGFTLIELLIVIAILGILSTIVVLSVRGIQDRGQSSACASDRKSLETAYEAAIANGNETDIATVAKIAKQTNPASADEIQRMFDTY